MSKLLFNFLKAISQPIIVLGKTLERIFNDPIDEYPVNDVLMDEHLISFNSAQGMYDEYIDKRYNILKPILGDDFSDSKSSWFSIETLQSYLNHLKKKDKLITENISGVRMYFGVYPENSSSQKAHQNGYLNHQNVFMVPTYFDETGEETMFYLTKGNGNQRIVNPIVGGTVSTMSFARAPEEDLVLMNEGNLRPPPMDETDPMDG